MAHNLGMCVEKVYGPLEAGHRPLEAGCCYPFSIAVLLTVLPNCYITGMAVLPNGCIARMTVLPNGFVFVVSTAKCMGIENPR